jgi:hypothetical protein
MREGHEPAGDLALEALHYASGEMTAAAAAAFEQRRGEDAAAREALCQAVQLAHALEGQTSPLPHPAYRDRVRRELRPGGRMAWLLARRPYPGHPLLWGALGVAATLLFLLVGVGQPRASLSPIDRPPPVVTEPARPATVEAASLWAELSNNEHLLKVRDEEMRRKSRTEEHPHIWGGVYHHEHPLHKAAHR